MVRVLRVWEAWSLYPQFFLGRLQETFLRRDSTEQLSKSREEEQPSAPQRDNTVGEAKANASALVVSEEPQKPRVLADDQIDGRPLEESILQRLLGQNLLAVEEVPESTEHTRD